MARIKPDVRDVLGSAGLIADDDRAEVVLKENGMSWCGHNVQRKRVLTYDVDGKMLPDQTMEKCDKAVVVVKKSPAPQTVDNAAIMAAVEKIYLIELKGSDLGKAVRQINSTLDALADKLAGVVVFARVVLSKTMAPDLKSTDLVRLKKRLEKTGGGFDKKCRVYQETL